MKLKEMIFKSLLRLFGPRGFGKMLVRSFRSPTYAVFCEKVYGRNLCQFNMVDEEQLDALITVMKPYETLDLGCGIGVVTEYLSDVLDSKIIGVDFAPLAISSAQDRTKDKADRLIFEVKDLNQLDFNAGQFHQIIAIDSFYFVRDINKTIQKIKAFLKPGGQFLAFYSSRAAGGVREDASATALAKALEASGFKVQARDFQKNEHAIWERTVVAAEELKKAFVSERAKDIYKSRIAEAKKNLEWQQAGVMARYLYIATRP